MGSSASCLSQASYECAYHNLLLECTRHLHFLELESDRVAFVVTADCYSVELQEAACLKDMFESVRDKVV